MLAQAGPEYGLKCGERWRRKCGTDLEQRVFTGRLPPEWSQEDALDDDFQKLLTFVDKKLQKTIFYTRTREVDYLYRIVRPSGAHMNSLQPRLFSGKVKGWVYCKNR